MKDEILRLEHIFIYNLDVPILNDFKLNIFKGEIVNLIGLSGAGKTVLLQLLNGDISAYSGKIIADGTVIDNHMQLYSSNNFFCVQQQSTLVKKLTVAENLFVISGKRKVGLYINNKNLRYRTQKLLDQYLPEVSPETLVSDLTHAQRIIVQLLKAVVEEAKLIIIDDIIQSFSLVEKQRFSRIFTLLKEKNISILYESHKIDIITQLSDRVIIMRKGQNVGTFYPNEINEYQIYSLAVGDEIAKPFFRKPSIQQEDILVLKNIQGQQYLKDVTVNLKKGEILGAYDIENHSNKELIKILTGENFITSGTIEIDHNLYVPKDIQTAINSGIGLILRGLAENDLLIQMNFSDNLYLSVMKKTSVAHFFTNKSILQYISKEYISKVGISENNKNKKIGCFDDYVKQSVLLYRWLLTKPKILVCVEPCAHADIIMQNIIYSALNEVAQNGTGILISSADLLELTSICDRILLLSDGKISGEYKADDIKKIREYTLMKMLY